MDSEISTCSFAEMAMYVCYVMWCDVRWCEVRWRWGAVRGLGGVACVVLCCVMLCLCGMWCSMWVCCVALHCVVLCCAVCVFIICAFYYFSRFPGHPWFQTSRLHMAIIWLDGKRQGKSDQDMDILWQLSVQCMNANFIISYLPDHKWLITTWSPMRAQSRSNYR